MKKIKKFIKEIDFFGHPILLHLDFKGENHKTLLGGILSIIYTFFTIAYFLFCIFKMVYHLQDNEVTLI